MPSLGMTGRWPGFAAPLVALLVTLTLTWLTAAVSEGAAASETFSGLALLILMPTPLVVSLIWGVALLSGRPYRLSPLAALVWLVVGLALVPHVVVWQLLGNVAAGLLAGLALGLRWRLDAALLATALALTPIQLWSTAQVPVDEQLEIISAETLKTLEHNLPATADDEQRAEALAAEKQKLDQLMGWAAKIYPFVLGIGVLGLAGIILSLLWLVIRALGMAPHRWHLPPFSRWRVPFYVVWALVIGLGGMVTRLPWVANAGLNLALLAACVLSVQGIAVQFFVTGRMMSNLGRLIYWSVMGFFFAPLIMVSGVLLGLADQWRDIRRLDAEDSDDSEGDDDENDEHNDDASDDDLADTPRDRFRQD